MPAPFIVSFILVGGAAKDGGLEVDRRLMLDGIHPTRTGMDLIAKQLVPVIARLFNEQQ